MGGRGRLQWLPLVAALLCGMPCCADEDFAARIRSNVARASGSSASAAAGAGSGDASSSALVYAGSAHPLQVSENQVDAATQGAGMRGRTDCVRSISRSINALPLTLPLSPFPSLALD
jgi:hypothetical protein